METQNNENQAGAQAAPEGYRPLVLGETIQKGDLCRAMTGDGEFFPSVAIGLRVNKEDVRDYFRRIPSEPTTQQAAPEAPQIASGLGRTGPDFERWWNEVRLPGYLPGADYDTLAAAKLAAQAAWAAVSCTRIQRESDLEAELEELETAGGDLQNERDALQARIAELEGALRAYGCHVHAPGPMCERAKHSDYPCTCGLENLLAGMVTK